MRRVYLLIVAYHLMEYGEDSLLEQKIAEMAQSYTAEEESKSYSNRFIADGMVTLVFQYGSRTGAKAGEYRIKFIGANLQTSVTSTTKKVFN